MRGYKSHRHITTMPISHLTGVQSPSFDVAQGDGVPLPHPPPLIVSNPVFLRVVHLIAGRPDLEISQPVWVNLLPNAIIRGWVPNPGKVRPHLQHAGTHLKLLNCRDLLLGFLTLLSVSLRTMVMGTWCALNSMNNSSAWHTPSLDLEL